MLFQEQINEGLIDQLYVGDYNSLGKKHFYSSVSMLFTKWSQIPTGILQTNLFFSVYFYINFQILSLLFTKMVITSTVF